MASTFIPISSTATPYSGELLSFVNQLRSLADQSAELSARYQQMAAGGDYTSLATYLNLSEGDATAVYNIFAGANSELHATNITQLTTRCG
jgi:hypothetical protein